jgi:hypothetical protein
VHIASGIGIARLLRGILFGSLLIFGCERAFAGQLPTVACAADGQMGPIVSPKHIGHVPPVPLSVAGDLAYYASSDLGVFAPRGWHCFGLYGSRGSQIIVTPEPHDADDLLRSGSDLKGPAVQLSYIYGGTSGRFEVAKIAARLFPIATAYVRQVIEEGVLPEEEFSSEPYPNDVLARRSETEVELKTPADSICIGTHSRLAKGNDPIIGVVLVFPKRDMDMVQLDVRLPPELARLAPAIVEVVEYRKNPPP